MEIINYPNYLIYDDGRVWSKERKDSMGRNSGGEFMKFGDNGNGYYNVRLCKDSKYKCLYIHRLIAEHYIPNPENKRCVDHINGIRNDNRIENLRWATDAENQHNRKKQSNNKTGFRSIYFNKERQLFVSRIKINHKQIHLGYYATAEEASAVYEAKAKEVFGEFYREIV